MFDEGEAINLVRLADAEMLAGNNAKARPLYRQAGDILGNCPKNVANKNAVLYSAAVAYFKGCFYQDALSILLRITTKVVDGCNMNDFIKTVKQRAEISDESIVYEYLKRENSYHPRDLLDMLINNPFMFPPKTMALKKADLLYRLSMYKEGDLFAEDARRLDK